MNEELQEIILKASMRFSSLQWRNQRRCFFERWAMIIANDHYVLLEDLSKSEPIWKWYQAQFRRIEKLFYQENKVYINFVDAPQELFDLFEIYAKELDEVYPITLINQINPKKQLTNGKRI